MDQDADAGVREQPRREHEIGQLLVPVRVGRPVEHRRACGRADRNGAARPHEAGELFRRLLAIAEHDHHRADLLRGGLAAEDDAHRFLGLLLGQRARERRPAPDGTDEAREVVRCGHRLPPKACG